MERITELEREIALLPAGCISRKQIRGITRYYLQWNENGKSKSKYIPEPDVEELEKQICRRRELQAELKKLKKDLPQDSPIEIPVFNLNLTRDEILRNMIAPVIGFQKRDCYSKLKAYINGKITPRVCSVYGLRRTGKTTLLWQAISELSEEQFKQTVYIKMQHHQTMRMLDSDLKSLYSLGYRYVFIDEVTFMEDFIDTASLLSDIYAAMGMKIVLSGTDSLGLWFASREELYDRTYMIHTTWIPFAEHARLLNDSDIDDYIRYGGTLRIGETDFDDPELKNEEVSFRDDESTRRYIDTAICKNIQHSLKCYEGGEHFRHLTELYDRNELTSAINRVIESMNHRFTLKVLTTIFESNDLRLARKNLLHERNSELRTDILDRINTPEVTARLMEILDIHNVSVNGTVLTDDHVHEIEEYLYALELIDYGNVRYIGSGAATDRAVLITQPGMRYCQALALIHSLLKDPVFNQINDAEKTYVIQRIENEIMGRMMEEIVLLETMRSRKNCDVFKLMFDVGEFDMVVYDRTKATCQLYEVKHSKAVSEEQIRHLVDSDKLKQTEERIAPIEQRCVIYRGESQTDKNGIYYQNVNDYLKNL